MVPAHTPRTCWAAVMSHELSRAKSSGSLRGDNSGTACRDTGE